MSQISESAFFFSSQSLLISFVVLHIFIVLPLQCSSTLTLHHGGDGCMFCSYFVGRKDHFVVMFQEGNFMRCSFLFCAIGLFSSYFNSFMYWFNFIIHHCGSTHWKITNTYGDTYTHTINLINNFLS